VFSSTRSRSSARINQVHAIFQGHRPESISASASEYPRTKRLTEGQVCRRRMVTKSRRNSAGTARGLKGSRSENTYCKAVFYSSFLYAVRDPGSSGAGDLVTKFFCGVMMKTRAQTKTDRFWRESERGRGYHDNGPCVERESTTTKGSAGRKYGAKDEVKRCSQATGPTLEQRYFWIHYCTAR
jgi:hypothetical protein